MTERESAVTVVVAGAVYDGGRLLAARRSAPPELAGRWELPGGKVEPGERPEDALVRELREELGIETEPVARVPGAWPLGRGYELWVWTVRLVSGEPRPLQDHDALRWVTAAQAAPVCRDNGAGRCDPDHPDPPERPERPERPNHRERPDHLDQPECMLMSSDSPDSADSYGARDARSSCRPRDQDRVDWLDADRPAVVAALAVLGPDLGCAEGRVRP